MSLYRKVIRVSAEDSPNVKRAKLLLRNNPDMPLEEVVRQSQVLPGVLPYDLYLHRKRVWNPMRQCIGLEGRFWESGTLLLFPHDWIQHANLKHRDIEQGLIGPSRSKRVAKGIGVDTAEGGDNTCICAVDEWGIIDMLSRQTPDTSVIPSLVLSMIKLHNCSPERVVFDAGGGGKEHADRLRSMGLKVRTVRFGEKVQLEPKRGLRFVSERLENMEEKYVYRNRRAQLYHEASILCDPRSEQGGYAIPQSEMSIVGNNNGSSSVHFERDRDEYDCYEELVNQLSVLPKLIDDEGRYYMLPKRKRDGKDTRQTLTELLGRSPDEADAFCLAVHGMLHKPAIAMAGVS